MILRPWCLSTGVRVQLESQVFFKFVADDAEIKLGDEVFIGYGTELDISHKLAIGSKVLIAPGCFVTDHHHRRGTQSYIAEQGCESKPVVNNDTPQNRATNRRITIVVME